jgi:hypothetical protein
MTDQDDRGTIHKTISIGILLSLAFLVPMSADPKLSRLILRGIPILMVPFFLIWSPGSVRQYFSSHATDRDIRFWGTIGLVLLALPCWILLPGLSPD